MRLHDMRIARKKIMIDGVEMIVSLDNPEPTVEQIGDTGMSIVTVGIVCDQVVLDGDQHDHPESTPIYDELMEGQ